VISARWTNDTVFIQVSGVYILGNTRVRGQVSGEGLSYRLPYGYILSTHRARHSGASNGSE